MELKLSAEEQQFLLTTLEQRHRELLREIAHTDRREFRQGLRVDEKLLESLISRLHPASMQGIAG